MKRCPGLSRRWDDVASRTNKYYLGPTLEKYRDWEFSRILDKWISVPLAYSLKTDTFEEAFGNGGSLVWLAQRSRTAIYLDVSHKIAQKAKNNNADNRISWIVADLSHMPFADASLDSIFSTNTYGYLEDILEGLKEANRLLKANGTLIITARNSLNFVAQAARSYKKLSFRVPDSYLIREFRGLLEKAGFTVKDYEPILHIPPFLNYLVGLIENKHNAICKAILKMMLSGLKYYGRSRTLLSYFTAWSVIYKAEKKITHRENAVS